MRHIKTGHRRLIPTGGSLAVTIPVGFLRKSGWKKGDRVAVVYDDILLELIIVRPVTREAEAYARIQERSRAKANAQAEIER